MTAELAHNWQIIGHSRQLGLLEQAKNNSRLAHAYIFAGPAQIGKRTIAKRLAQLLLCDSATACGQCNQCTTLLAGSNPDFLEITSDDVIKIESIRDLVYKMCLKPYGGKYKIAVIDNAHNLTTEAANSLLKLLEEPTPNTLIVLVTHNPHQLLSTISSRAQKLSFGPVEAEEFNLWVEQNNFDANHVKHLAHYVGRPGLVLSLEKNVEERVVSQQRAASFDRLANASAGTKMVMAAELAEQETTDVKKTLDYWLGRMQHNLRQDPSTNLVSNIKHVMRAQRLLDQNVNPKLLLSQLMLAIN